MTQTFDMILRNGTVHLPGGPATVDVGVTGGRIAAIGASLGDGGETIDCAGLDVLPGVIDSQVHFREPGLEHKEDLESGSRAAVLGGVTAVFEMPNTNPNTDTAARIEDKLARAHHRMWCDHAFYVGATGDNAEQLGELEKMPGTAGVKIFMGASTGSLLVAEDEALARCLAHGKRRVAIHAEDEARMNARKDERVEGDPASHPVWRDDESAMLATRRIVALAREAGRRIHVLHITTPAELEFLGQNKDIATCEVTPQHLTLAGEEAYPRLGTYAQMNPPIRSAAHRDGLWHWLGRACPMCSAPIMRRTRSRRRPRAIPPRPAACRGCRRWCRCCSIMSLRAGSPCSASSISPAPGRSASSAWSARGASRSAMMRTSRWWTLKSRWTMGADWLASRCGWSPFEGMEVTGRPIGTIVRGHRVMWEAQLANAAVGEPVRFEATQFPGH